MSRRIVNVTIEPGWLPTDTIRVYRGTENAADLASSASVQLVGRAKVGGAATGSIIAIEFDHVAQDKCGTLPIGVAVKDQAGNEHPSRKEGLMPLMDPPIPPGRPDVAATANPGEALLSWTASPDLQP